MRRNINRGYQKLRVWNESIDYYVLTCSIVRKFPYDLIRVAGQAIASADSIHRNIAEGYCRRSIKEYLHFLIIALSSLGESVSGVYAFYKARQINKDEYQNLDIIAYKLENGLLKLIESLEKKKAKGDWIDHFY